VSLDGARVLVTGGSRGLGLAISEAFSARGAHVLVGCRVRQRGARQVAEALPGPAEVVAFDQRDRAAVEAALRDRPVDILVNNAALTAQGWFPVEGGEAFDDVLATNLLGPANVSRAVLPAMLARARGAIVHVGSVTTERTLPGHAAYTTAKAGLMGLTRAMAQELAPRGVRVNAVIPGLLDTGMGARMPRDLKDAVVQRIPAGRAGTAAEVADAVVFLATATYIHGACLVVDGGLSL
jgi:3-oxoacyl-[acyl-carrier protein] reductase